MNKLLKLVQRQLNDGKMKIENWITKRIKKDSLSKWFPVTMFFVTPAVTAGQWHSRCSSCSSNINRTWRPRRPRRRSLGVPGLWQESMGFLAVDTINGLLYHWFMMICRGSSLQLELLDWVAECCRTVVEWFFGGVLFPKWRIDVCKFCICIIQNTICL